MILNVVPCGSPVSGQLVNQATAPRIDRSTIFTATSSATVAGTTAETSLIGSGFGSKTIPANVLVIGKSFRVTATGAYTTGSTTRDLNIKLKLGSIILAQTTSLTASKDAVGTYWEVIAVFTCRSIGVSGTVTTQARFLYQDVSAARTAICWGMSSTTPITINTTIDNSIDLTNTWSAAPNNSNTCVNVLIEALN